MTGALKEFEERNRREKEKFAQAEVHVRADMILMDNNSQIDLAVFLSCIMCNFCIFVQFKTI